MKTGHVDNVFAFYYFHVCSLAHLYCILALLSWQQNHVMFLRSWQQCKSVLLLRRKKKLTIYLALGLYNAKYLKVYEEAAILQMKHEK